MMTHVQRGSCAVRSHVEWTRAELGGGSLNSEVQCLGPLAKAGGDLGWRAGQGVGTSVWWDSMVRKR